MVKFSPRRFCPIPSAGGGSIIETGTLTTRTDDNTGIVTIDNALHAIETSAAVEVTWAGGSRGAMVVGTVAGVSVPIDAGVGDVLPAQGTEVTVTVLPELGTVEPFGWWDFSKASSLTTYLDIITRISAIEDLSGNNRTLEQPVGQDGPQTNVSTSNSINGRQVAVFSNGYLTLEFGETIAQPFTFVQVFRAASDTPLQMTYFDGIAADPNRAVLYKAPSGGGDTHSLYAGTAFNSSLPPISVLDEFIQLAIWDGASSAIIVNAGTPQVGNPGVQGLTGITVGNKWDFTGTAGFQRLGECAFWDRRLTTQEIADVFSILNGKWAIY